MNNLGFDQARYLALQTTAIRQRVQRYDKFYLEVGGKIADDLHAARVLPGFDPEAKIKVLQQLGDQIEVILCVSALSLLEHKTRGDSGLDYLAESLRLVEFFRQKQFVINNIVITLCDQPQQVASFQQQFVAAGLTVHIHARTAGYPHDIQRIVSPAGYGQNSFIQTTQPIVVIAAPGPGSGKMATALSQIYHEYQAGRSAGYAKYETFPVWNLSLDHPVNVAYEAATLDLADYNLLDYFHQQAYGVTAVNYNRDVATFPVLTQIFQQIEGKSPYQSPTDMGVNMVAEGIADMMTVEQAALAEIVRRYCQVQLDYQAGKTSLEIVERAERLLKRVGLDQDNPWLTELKNQYLLTHQPTKVFTKPSSAML